MKVLRVRMSDDTIWEIPAAVIAQNRALYYCERDPETTFDIEFEASMDDYEIEDWSSNNMDWEDVQSYAKLIPHPKEVPDYHRQWPNAEREVLDV